MRKPVAAVLSAAFFVAAPGTMAGLIPWVISRWNFGGWGVAQVAGAVLILVGVVPPVFAFVEFVRAEGTPIPVAPTRRLVVAGFNRFVRNPMYAGLVVAILGQALLFGSVGLVVWAAVFWGTTAAFVRWYEEPTLVEAYGEEYLEYRRNVPAWLPRLRPWTPRASSQASPL